MDKEQLAIELFDIQAIKFGSFTLKSGLHSPVYLDLRLIISYPNLLTRIAEMMWEKAASLEFDLVCGVPYTALPLATCFSTAHEIPMILRRKETKDYGTKKRVEGVYQKGETCLILEDVMTTGSSIIETAASLKEEGLIVQDAIVVVDRQQGGKEKLSAQKIHAHALITLPELAEVLYDDGKIDKNVLAAMNIEL